MEDRTQIELLSQQNVHASQIREFIADKFEGKENLHFSKKDVNNHITRVKKSLIGVAAATNDASYPPAMGERLERALMEARVPFRAETYPAAHGWMKPDFPVFDEAAAERG